MAKRLIIDWEETIMGQLSSISYQSGITYYYDLAQRFLNAITLDRMEIEREAIRSNFLNNITNSVPNNVFEDMTAIEETAYSIVNKIWSETIDNPSLNTLNNLRNQNEKRLSTLTEQVRITLDQEISDFITSKDNLLNDFNAILEKYSQFGNGAEVTVKILRSWFQSTLTRLLLDKQNKIYKTQAGGYLQELNKHGAILNFIENFKLSNVSAKAIGGKNTIIDELYTILLPFEHLDQFLGTSELNIASNGDITLNYGQQIKLYQLPNQKRQAYQVISSQNLLSQFTKQRSEESLNSSMQSTIGWIKNVQFLESQIINALGSQNVLYSLGNKTIWTFELIKLYRQKSYFLGFMYDNDGNILPTIAWQLVNIHKPKDKRLQK